MFVEEEELFAGGKDELTAAVGADEDTIAKLHKALPLAKKQGPGGATGTVRPAVAGGRGVAGEEGRPSGGLGTGAATVVWTGAAAGC